jgi:DNA-directed RNA polymerase specialized sigma24 family protein
VGQDKEFQQVVDAILDLTRITLATSERFESRADAIRQLSEMSVPPARLAAIFNIPTKDVTSVLSRARKKAKEQTNG